MPIPQFLPLIEPVIPDGYLFVAVTLVAPTDLCPSGCALMGWPVHRRDADGNPYEWPITPERVEERILQEGYLVQSWRIIPYAAIPKDRTYRDAWADVGTLPLAHNMTKARDIHRQHLRVQRAVKMADLDTAYLRADEANDQAEKKRIADHKQRLRDLPTDPAIAAAQTIEALKAFWPDDLT